MRAHGDAVGDHDGVEDHVPLTTRVLVLVVEKDVVVVGDDFGEVLSLR